MGSAAHRVVLLPGALDRLLNLPAPRGEVLLDADEEERSDTLVLSTGTAILALGFTVAAADRDFDTDPTKRTTDSTDSTTTSVAPACMRLSASTAVRVRTKMGAAGKASRNRRVASRQRLSFP